MTSTACFKQPLKNDEGVISLGKDWKCKWCETVFKTYNASRALAHFACLRLHGNTGVSFCTGSIPLEKSKYYKARAKWTMSTQTKKKKNKDNFNHLIDITNNNVAHEVVRESVAASNKKNDQPTITPMSSITNEDSGENKKKDSQWFFQRSNSDKDCF
jgi:hypothetical protein